MAPASSYHFCLTFSALLQLSTKSPNRNFCRLLKQLNELTVLAKAEKNCFSVKVKTLYRSQQRLQTFQQWRDILYTLMYNVYILVRVYLWSSALVNSSTKNLMSCGFDIRHWRPEFIKHVLPRLRSPATPGVLPASTDTHNTQSEHSDKHTCT